jgi:selenoprotein W-related protein
MSAPAASHRIEIEYCVQCRWLLRASWIAQELLSTFDGDVAALTLKPATGGAFNVSLDGQLLWSRKEHGRFPEITELKQMVRDRIDPQRDLGHIDRARQKKGES